MSPDVPVGPNVVTHRRRGWRTAGLVLLGLLIALALLIAVAFPWGPISGLQVERAELVAGPPPERRKDPSDTPQKVAVTFSVPDELSATRKDKGADVIRAVMSACIESDVEQGIQITHGGAPFDDPRLQVLTPSGQGGTRRFRYRAVFDNWLPMEQGHSVEIVEALGVGGGLCFSLDGGAMFLGRLWSDRIPLKLTPAARSATN